MKKFHLVILLAIVTIFTVSAADVDVHRVTPARRAEAIARQLHLDASLSKRFIPVYTEYCSKVDAIFSKYPAPNPGKLRDADDAAIKTATDNRFKVARLLMELREQYYKKYQKILSPRQIDKLYRVEKNYEHQLHRREKNKSKKGPRCRWPHLRDHPILALIDSFAPRHRHTNIWHDHRPMGGHRDYLGGLTITIRQLLWIVVQ